MLDKEKYSEISIDLEVAQPSVRKGVEQALASGDSFLPENQIFLAAGLDTEEVESNYYTPNQRALAKSIFDSLISIFKETPESSRSQCVWKTYETFFSFSPNLFNYLSVSDQFLVLAELESYPEWQMVTRSGMGEFNYNLDWAGSGFSEHIAEAVEGFSAIERLQVLRLVKKLAIQAKAEGMYNNFFTNLRSVNKAIAEKANEAFFQYVCDDVQAELDTEDFRSAPWHQDEKDLAAITHQRLGNQTIQTCSSDYWSFYDGSSRPNGLIEAVGTSVITPEQARNNNTVKTLTNFANQHPDTIATNGVLLETKKLIDSGIIEAGVLSKVDEDFWAELDSLNAKYDEVDGQASLAEASDKNLAATLSFIDAFLDDFPDEAKSVLDIDALREKRHQPNQLDILFGDISWFLRAYQLRNETLSEVAEAIDSEERSPLNEFIDQQVRELEKLNFKHQINFKQSGNRQKFAQAVVRKKIEAIEIKFSNYGMTAKDVTDLLSTAFVEVETPELKITTYAEVANSENPFADEESDDLGLLMQEVHNPFLRRRVETELGTNLADFSFQDQLYLLRFLLTQTTEEIKAFAVTLAQNQNQTAFIKAFVLSANDSEFCTVLTTLATKEGAETLFELYSRYASSLEKSDEQEVEVKKALLFRGKQLFLEAYRAIGDADEVSIEIVFGLEQKLATETKAEQVTRGFLADIGNAFRRKNVDLRDYAAQQAQMMAVLKESPELPLKVLAAQGSLKPIPEIHWRVDRNDQEYKRRFGISPVKMLKQNSSNGVILEMGSGNGAFKAEVEAECPNSQCISVADQLYYPLDSLICNQLDWELIEGEIGLTISDEERKIIADFCWKTVVIKAGELASDDFDYDEDWQKSLAQNPESIKAILATKAHLLKDAQLVPSTISTRDDAGRVIYPYKIERPQSEAFNAALNLIAESPQACLKGEEAITNIEAYGAGVVVADFKQIDHLQPKQISALFSVRGWVYLQGQDYIDSYTSAFGALENNGIIIDDSIRDNDGWYYRLAEMKQIQDSIDKECYVICGQGFEGEDYNQKDLVPLAVVISKSEQKRAWVESNLEDGYELRRLDDILSDSAYLESLDSTGKVKNEVQALAA